MKSLSVFFFFFFDVVVFLLSSLVTGPNFMSISLLVLELRQFLFIRDRPEIRKSEITPSVLCPISEDWGELRIPNLVRMCPMKSYLMHAATCQVYSFYCFRVIKGKPSEGKNMPHPD